MSVPKINKEPVVVKVPPWFARYPNPPTSSILDGQIDVSLGRWKVEGREAEFHLRINGPDLPKLISAIMKNRGHELRFGYDSLHVFRVGGT